MGERIKSACIAAGKTPAALGKSLGIRKQYMSGLVVGRVKASKHIPAIAAALGVEIEWLTTGNGKEPTWCIKQIERHESPNQAMAAKVDQQSQTIAGLAAELSKLAETNSNLCIRQFRLGLAVKHAERHGIETNPSDIAATEGLDRWAVVRAIVNGDDLDEGKSLKAVAKRLEITTEWLLRGINEPPWYVEQLRRVAMPADHQWSAERQRIIATLGPIA